MHVLDGSAGMAHSNGLELYYETRGKGTPILLINGLGASALGWEPELIQSLAESYKVITFDNRGTGRSDKPDSGYSIPDMAQDCIAVLGAQELSQSHVVGASMGGRIALELAVAYPKKVRSLVLCCTDCGRRQQMPYKGTMEVNRFLRIFFRLRRTESELNSEALKLFFTEDFIEENWERLEAHWRRISKYPTPSHVYRRQLEATLAHNICSRLAQITVPTLVLGGDHDLLNPVAKLEELASKIPKAQLHIYSGLGHGFMFEAREDVAQRILEFLNRA